jgi:hypothetical protein
MLIGKGDVQAPTCFLKSNTGSAAFHMPVYVWSRWERLLFSLHCTKGHFFLANG